MSVAIRCAGCGSRFSVSEALIGRKVRCHACTHVILVGAAEEEPAVLEVRRPTRRRGPRADDEERPRFRRRRSRDNQPVMMALLIGGIAVGVLLLGLAFVGGWWLLNKEGTANAPDTTSAPPASLAANPAPQTQFNPAPATPPNQPPVTRQPPVKADGGAHTVQLSNARVSGFGARLQIEVDYRFNTGVAGPDLYLMVKPTHLGLHQTLYEVHLRHSVGKAQGTVVAAGMTFGIESGPFEVWMEEGGPPGLMRGFGGPQRRTISNVLHVQTKEFSLPGPMRPPTLPGMPHIPRPGFPFGPRR